MLRSSKHWWKDRFFTLMVIPERTRQVHKVMVPFFVMKLGLVLFSLAFILLVIVGIDYIHILGQMGENKRLKGENFKLRQEIQLIRNKVDSMQWTIERVRNYAKKLQLLTGQTEKYGKDAKGESDAVWGDEEIERAPASKPERHSSALPHSRELDEPELSAPPVDSRAALNDRVEHLQKVSLYTEANLSLLQSFLMARRAIVRATPSLLPISGYVSSNFGYRTHPLDGVYRLHAGIDIAAQLGTPVHAPADATVIFSGYKEGYGKVVVLDHGYGITTLFAHNSKLFVSQGLKVKRGDIISAVGSTGMSTGPHLHYEVRKRGVPVNPSAFASSARF